MRKDFIRELLSMQSMADKLGYVVREVSLGDYRVSTLSNPIERKLELPPTFVQDYEKGVENAIAGNWNELTRLRPVFKEALEKSMSL